MYRCWAKCLGDCDGGISGEHIVSAGLFKEAILYVNGPPWKTTSLKPLPKNTIEVFLKLPCKKIPVTLIQDFPHACDLVCRRHTGAGS